MNTTDVATMAGWMRCLAVAGGLFSPLTGQLTGQEEPEPQGSSSAAVGGAALGLLSAATLASVGSLIPCERTYMGIGCVRLAGAVAGIAGLASGAAIGEADRVAIGEAYRNAGIGLLLGTAAGLAIHRTTPSFTVPDALTLGVVGASLAATGYGGVIGLGVGAMLGGAMALVLPDFGLPEAVSTALAGMAIGGLGAWVAGGVQARTDTGSVTTLVLPFEARF